MIELLLSMLFLLTTNQGSIELYYPFLIRKMRLGQNKDMPKVTYAMQWCQDEYLDLLT